MIDYIKGSIVELNPAYAVIDNHGIGYMMNITLTTFDALSKGGVTTTLFFMPMR